METPPGQPKKWFKIWLDQRRCVGDREIFKVLKRVQDRFAIESESRYVPIEEADKVAVQGRLDFHGEKVAGYACSQYCSHCRR